MRLLSLLSSVGAFSLVLSQTTDATAQSGNACDPTDQLACACSEAGVADVNATVKACFLGDVNTVTANQADNFSTQIFSAINWPVKLDENGRAIAGMPDYGSKLEGDWTTVWETWKSTNSIFRRDAPPIAWNETDVPLPRACAQLDLKAEMAKVSYADRIPNVMQPRLLDEYLNPEGRAFLDRNGRPVRYDVIFNKQAYEFTTSNNLWDAKSLTDYLDENGQLELPAGTWNTKDIGPERGAIVLKSSWMVMDEKHDPDLFHKAWAFVSPIIMDGKVDHGCALEPVALIGLHVVYKTEQFANWGWGTFEHRHIAPLWSEIGSTTGGVYPDGRPVPDWLFYSRDSGGAATLNAQPKHVTEGIPSRITSYYPPGYYAEPIGKSLTCSPTDQNFWCFNERLHEGFSQAAFKNYVLKGTQWELLNSGGKLIPEILGNTTMESFSQETSSCQTCHSYAKPDIPGSKRETLDFIFSFNRDVLKPSVPVQGQ